MIRRTVSPLLLRAGLRHHIRHRWQALLALVGVMMGVAVVIAVDLANAAASASFAQSASQLRGAATHRLIGSQGYLPQALYTDLFTTPGHPPMAPVISTRVRVEGLPGRFRLIGIDPLAEGSMRRDLGSAISGTDDLRIWLSRPGVAALSTSAADHLGVTIGDSLPIRHQGNPYRLEILAIGVDDSLASRDLLVTDIATAQALSGMRETISHIDLILDAAAEAWLAGRQPASARLLSVNEQTQGIVGLSAAFELNLTAMSLLAMLVGAFLIFNALSLSIVQRRNLLGRLRALGVTGAQIHHLIVAEAMALGIVGTLLGSLLGIALGQGLTTLVAATVSELYYDVPADALQLNAWSLAKGALLGLGGTVLAAWFPATQAARTAPLTTLSRAALEQSTRHRLPRLGIAGAVMMPAGLLLAFVAPGGVIAGFAGLFVVLLGAALLTPLALHLVHGALDRLPIRGVWRMAARDLDRHLSRLGTAGAALMVALAASVGVAVMVESMRSAVGEWLGDLLSADLYIASEAFDDAATLPQSIVTQAPHLAPVSAASYYRNRTLHDGNRRITLVAADLAAQSRTGFDFVAQIDGDLWQRFASGEVLISEPFARRSKLNPGDVLHLPTPAGDAGFPVAAVFRDYASEHGRVFIARPHYLAHWSDTAVNTVALFSDQGAAALLQAVSAQFATEDGLVFTAARAIYDESMAVFDRTFRITEALRLLSLLVAFVGILSALMAVQLERRKEFAVLRALGLTRWQLSQLIVVESALIGVLAALLAIPAGLLMAWVLTAAIQLRAFGWSMPFVLGATPLWSALALGTGAAVLAALYPAWRASMHDPAPQLRED